MSRRRGYNASLHRVLMKSLKCSIRIVDCSIRIFQFLKQSLLLNYNFDHLSVLLRNQLFHLLFYLLIIYV